MGQQKDNQRAACWDLQRVDPKENALVAWKAAQWELKQADSKVE